MRSLLIGFAALICLWLLFSAAVIIDESCGDSIKCRVETGAPQ